MTETEPAIVQPPPAADAPPTSPWERIVGVLFSPDETFRDVTRRPDILVPLIVIIVVSTVCSFLVAPRMEFESMREQMSRSGNMGPDDIDRAMRISGAMTKVVTYASPLLTLAVLAVVTGVLLLAFRLFGGEGTFKQAFSTVLYAWIPRVIYGVILAIVVVGRGSIDVADLPAAVYSSPAFLVSPAEHPVLSSLLTSFELFNLWTIVLLIIGFAHVSRFSKAKSAITIVSIWLFITFVKLGFAALGAMRMKAAS